MREPDLPQTDAEDDAQTARCEQVKSMGALGKLRLWLARTVVASVPDDVARCEFECRVVNCAPDEIRACEQRIDYARTGTVNDTRSEDLPD